MSYDALERSAADGRPVDLFTFTRGSGLVWRYTSADRDLTVDAQQYASAVIRRGQIEQGPEPQRSNLRITTAHDFPIAEMFKISPPSDPILLVLRQYHYGDTDIATIWQGSIINVSFSGAEADIELQPLSGEFRATGLRRNYQRSCPYDLYGPSCKVSLDAYRVTGTAGAISGVNLTVTAADALADGHFSGGFIEWEIAAGIYERRFISKHLGAILTLDVQPIGLVVGTAVRIYPGCDHSLQTCHTKFANSLNYGGMPYIPSKNPFGSDPLY